MTSLCVVLMLISSITGDAKMTTRFDFQDATVGKLPADWTATQTGKGEGSVWKVVVAAGAPKGKKALAQTAANAPGGLFNLCIADKSKFGDLDMSVAFKAIAGEKDQGGGPVWRFKDAKNYYVARMNPLEDNFRLYKVVDGKRIQLATTKDDVKADPKKWHTIRVVHVGDRIECYFNGKKLLEAKDDSFKEAGKIGLWTKADAQTYFNDLAVVEAKK
jgi:Domain of Unknown Function (DUF1080)